MTRSVTMPGCEAAWSIKPNVGYVARLNEHDLLLTKRDAKTGKVTSASDDWKVYVSGVLIGNAFVLEDAARVAEAVT